jgi:hypothetical protein
MHLRRFSGNAKTARKPPASSSSRTKAVREWARTNGCEVSDGGGIPADVKQAYTTDYHVARTQ